MKQSRPLTYQCSKIIFQYLDANWRFQKSRCFPSLRKMQQTVPLTLNLLKLTDTSFVVDSIEYYLGTVLQNTYKKEEREGYPKYIGKKRGGLLYDVDEDGHQDMEEVLIPGDIKIELDQEEQERNLAPWFGYHISWTSLNLYHLSRNYRRQRFLGNIRSVDGKKLRDAIRQLTTKLFIARGVHFVRRLEIDVSSGILRLPEGLKLRIRVLSVPNNANKVIEAIRPILDSTSFPLRSLLVDVDGPYDPVFQNDILRSSEYLKIDVIKNFQIVPGSWAEVLKTLPNKMIHTTEEEIPVDDIIALARDWTANPRIVGTKFWAITRTWFKHLNTIKKQILAVRSGIWTEKCSRCEYGEKFRITPKTQLYIYGYELNREQEWKYGKPCMFVMEVIPIGE